MMRNPSQQNSQDNTPKKDSAQLMIENNPCGGHTSNEVGLLKVIPSADFSTSVAPTFSIKNEKATPKFELDSNDKRFDIELIIKLLEKKILSIENNSELGILHIKCNSALHALLSENEKAELNKLLTHIQTEFNEFKNKNTLSSEDCSIRLDKDNQNNILSLTISIKNPNFYDAFIEHLTNHFIASPTNKKSNVLLEENVDKKNPYLPNPFNIDNGPST